MPSNTDDEAVPDQTCKRILKRTFRLLFTHVGLALLLIAYAVVGAVAFQAIEAPRQEQEIDDMKIAQRRVLETLWNITRNQYDNFTEWVDDVGEIFQTFEHEHKQPLLQSLSDDQLPSWTFYRSLFFACTVFTTIGYGHMAPETAGGRVFCMIYALFGIPLLMLVLVDLGTLLARGTKYLYLRLFRPHILRKTRRVSCFDKQKKGEEKSPEPEKGTNFKNPMTDPDSQKDENWKTEYGHNAIVMEDNRDDDGNEGRERLDDVEFDIPILAILGFGFLYVCILALLLSLWEEWTYFECFYFSFITLSTIGFGDLVPEHQKNTIAASFLILFGMTVMTMCITLSQNKIQHSLKYVGWRIGVKSKPKPDGKEDETKPDSTDL
ncbi:potassium channel subfamily K member 18-like [Glandiceps talaboti]